MDRGSKNGGRGKREGVRMEGEDGGSKNGGRGWME